MSTYVDHNEYGMRVQYRTGGEKHCPESFKEWLQKQSCPFLEYILSLQEALYFFIDSQWAKPNPGGLNPSVLLSVLMCSSESHSSLAPSLPASLLLFGLFLGKRECGRHGNQAYFLSYGHCWVSNQQEQFNTSTKPSMFLRVRGQIAWKQLTALDCQCTESELYGFPLWFKFYIRSFTKSWCKTAKKEVV